MGLHEELFFAGEQRKAIHASLWCGAAMKVHWLGAGTEEEEYCVEYLGVTVDSKLRWHKHISNITAKANSTLGFIRRNVLTTSEEIKSLAFKQLVRPVLEYASSAWDSLTQTQETSLEAVQTLHK